MATDDVVAAAPERAIVQDEKDLGTEHIEKHHGRAGKTMDDAARMLAEAGGQYNFSVEDGKRVLRRIDLFVCIPMCLTYFIQQLDKSALSYAAVFNIQEDVNLVGVEYAWLTSVVYCAQLVCQPLSSYALIVLPVKYWVIGNFIAWSVVTIATAACKNFISLLMCRMLLGAFEATILPSFVLITQMWWTRREQSYRTIAYQIANSVAAIIGPLMAYGVGHAASGSIKAYQAIFLFIGSFSIAFVPLVWWLLPNSPTTANFLRKGEDRLVALERIRENNTGTKSSTFKWHQVRETLSDPKTYMWAAMYFCCATPSGGFGAFGGLITKGFGFSSFITVLMQMPVGAIGIVELLVSIYITNKLRLRFPVLAVICLFPIAGAVSMIYIPRSKTGGLLGAYYVAYLLAALQPLLYSWANLNAAGTTKRVVTTAVMFCFQCAGNIVGPQVYLKKEAPVYRTGLYVDIGCWSILCLLILAMGFHLRRLNIKQKNRRIALGLPEELEDMSIMPFEEAAAYKLALIERMAAQGIDEARLYENAFDDMTDFENPMFIYVL